MPKIPFRVVMEDVTFLNVEDQVGKDAELTGGEIYFKMVEDPTDPGRVKISPTLTLDFLVEKEYLLKALPEMLKAAASL